MDNIKSNLNKAEVPSSSGPTPTVDGNTIARLKTEEMRGEKENPFKKFIDDPQTRRLLTYILLGLGGLILVLITMISIFGSIVPSNPSYIPAEETSP